MQETNDAATTSKASMEHAGYTRFANSSSYSKNGMEKEPPASYAHLFVQRVERRSALINRGYATRCAIMKQIILDIASTSQGPLPTATDQGGVCVVSLGGGFDTTYLHLNPQRDGVTTYIEIDLPDVIARKRAIIEKHSSIAPKVEHHLLAVDLLNLDLLESSLRKVFQGSEGNGSGPFNAVVFTSECVLSYLPTEGADALISWASKTDILPSSTRRYFILYEQLLGEFDPLRLDPFASTMTTHFRNIGSPIHSAYTYPTLPSISRRLTGLGWPTASVCNLHGAIHRHLGVDRAIWIDSECNIEVFDEWEEWQIKKAHYYVAVMSMGAREEDPYIKQLGSPPCDDPLEGRAPVNKVFEWAMPIAHARFPQGETREQSQQLQRWSHACIYDNDKVVVFGGYAGKRLGDLCFLHLDNKDNDGLALLQAPSDGRPNSPCPRLYHTMHRMGAGKYLICGGRTDPSTVLRDVWVYEDTRWTCLLDNLPIASARHQSVLIPAKNLLYIFDGQKCLRVDLDKQTHAVQALRNKPLLDLMTSGLSFTCTFWPKWNAILVVGEHGNAIIDLVTCTVSILEICNYGYDKHSGRRELPRLLYNACMPVDTLCWHGLLLHGGLNAKDLTFNPHLYYIDLHTLRWHRIAMEAPQGRVEAIKHASVVVAAPNSHLGDALEIVTVGGGFVCFSMGSWYNKPVSVIRVQAPLEVLSLSKPSGIPPCLSPNGIFQHALFGKEPFIINCPRTPNSQCALTRVQGSLTDETLVSIHLCSETQMRFVPTKNYQYKVIPWQSMWQMLLQSGGMNNHEGERVVALTTGQATQQFVYFRSIGDNPRKQPSDALKMMPVLGELLVGLGLQDLLLPVSKESQESANASLIGYTLHSSVLRISSPGLSLWTHYDVLDNVLVQLSGYKIVTLWHPLDCKYLATEGSSSVADYNPFKSSSRANGEFMLNSNRLPSSQDSSRLLRDGHRPRHFILGPCQALHIPAFWFHHVRSISHDDIRAFYTGNDAPALTDSHALAELSAPSIAVNLFYKDDQLSSRQGIYSPKDLYGNAEYGVYTDTLKVYQKMRGEGGEDGHKLGMAVEFYENKLFYESS